jgi:hypothetical protein
MHFEKALLSNMGRSAGGNGSKAIVVPHSGLSITCLKYRDI